MIGAKSLSYFRRPLLGLLAGVFGGKIGGEEESIAEILGIGEDIIFIFEDSSQFGEQFIRMRFVLDLVAEQIAHVEHHQPHCAAIQATR